MHNQWLVLSWTALDDIHRESFRNEQEFIPIINPYYVCELQIIQATKSSPESQKTNGLTSYASTRVIDNINLSGNLCFFPNQTEGTRATS